MNNTFIDFVLSNGEEVKLTYYFRALDVVFSKEESDGLKEAWLNAAVKGTNHTMDVVKSLYVAYLCGQAEQIGGICSLRKDIYTLDQFMDLLSQDIHYIHQTFVQLIKPKKKPDLKKLSGQEQEE